MQLSHPRLLAAAVVVGAALFAPSAQAGLVTVDPDAFSAGTDISLLYPGITLSAIGQIPTSVFSTLSSVTSTGTRVFGNANNGVEWGDGFNAGMRVDFANATNHVQIDIIGNDSFDQGQLLAFDGANNLLATFTSSGLGFGQIQTASVTRAAADIAYVIATGSANGAESISLDNLQFESNLSAVPEPSTLISGGLAAMAALGFAWRRRKAKAIA